MKRAILLLAGLACCGVAGCDTQTAAKLILAAGVKALALPRTDTLETSDGPAASPNQPVAIDELVTAMEELNQVRDQTSPDDGARTARLTALLDRISALVGDVEDRSTISKVLVQQAREAQAVALHMAETTSPADFAGRRDAYWQETVGRAWDRNLTEKEAINRLVTGYLVAPDVPADVRHVLALHAVTFPRHAMNVELYTTIAERLSGEGNLLEGLELARAGLHFCAAHSDVDRLKQRVKQIQREHPGEIGVPMNFAGPTLHERRFVLSSLRGGPALVVFWSASDATADAFMTRCNGLAEKYLATDLKVVGVCLDANMQDMERWHFDQGFTCRQVYSLEAGHQGFENPVARFYNVKTVPQFFLLDHDGIVVARGSNQTDLIEDYLRPLVAPPAEQPNP